MLSERIEDNPEAVHVGPDPARPVHHGHPAAIVRAGMPVSSPAPAPTPCGQCAQFRHRAPWPRRGRPAARAGPTASRSRWPRPSRSSARCSPLHRTCSVDRTSIGAAPRQPTPPAGPAAWPDRRASPQPQPARVSGQAVDHGAQPAAAQGRGTPSVMNAKPSTARSCHRPARPGWPPCSGFPVWPGPRRGRRPPMRPNTLPRGQRAGESGHGQPGDGGPEPGMARLAARPTRRANSRRAIRLSGDSPRRPPCGRRRARPASALPR